MRKPGLWMCGVIRTGKRGQSARSMTVRGVAGTCSSRRLRVDGDRLCVSVERKDRRLNSELQ